MEQAYTERDKTESSSLTGEYVEHYLTGEAIPGIAYEFNRAQQVLPGITLADLNAVAKGWLTGGAPVILVNAPEKNRALIPTPADLLGLFASVKRAEIAAYAETVSDAALVSATLPWCRSARSAATALRERSSGRSPTASGWCSNPPISRPTSCSSRAWRREDFPGTGLAAGERAAGLAGDRAERPG